MKDKGAREKSSANETKEDEGGEEEEEEETRDEGDGCPGSEGVEPTPSELPPLPVPRTPRSTNPVAIQTEPDPERESRETQV